MSPEREAGGALPIAGERRERADAAANRERVLSAARRLFAKRRVEDVTVEEIAREAGVGKGTVFHRFGDRAGLALALIDDRERELQDEVIGGRPPVGPGAPPEERLEAFLKALLDFTREHLELLIAADGGKAGGRYVTGAYAFWHRHVANLVAELDAGNESELLAHLLLAPLAPDLVAHLEGAISVDPEEIARELGRLVAAVHAG